MRVLAAIFSHVSRDEAAHADFYRAVIEMELGENRTDTVADFAHVLSRFKMPGDGLIPDYRERLRSGLRVGRGTSAQKQDEV
jgi:acyl-[acyl-carrier-protein] desaturase